METSIWAWVVLGIVIVVYYGWLLLLVIGTPEERAEWERFLEDQYQTRKRMGLVSKEEEKRRSGAFHG